jgi:hypothetical protein
MDSKEQTQAVNQAKISKRIPVKLLATIPRGEMSVADGTRAIPLPAGPHGREGEADLHFGPYLEAVHHMLAKDDYRKLVKALRFRLHRVVAVEEIDCLEIKTEKHGASYQVARIEVSVAGAGQKIPFAVNVAATPEAREELERDFRLLKVLNRRYKYNILPLVYFKGAGLYRDSKKPAKWLHMFVAEWFRGYHEFHLHRDDARGVNLMLLWDSDKGYQYISQEECLELYRQTARILTLYYDYHNFKQIYPWHHAAGDFVLKIHKGEVHVRLITIRDYGAVVDSSSRKRAAKLLGLIIFFLHLTIQMRVDRLDGVGPVVWAEDHCLDGTVSGFFAGWEESRKQSKKKIPSAEELRDLLRSFSKDEWLHFLVEMLETYTFSQEEVSLLRYYGDAHIGYLINLLSSAR